MNDSYNIFGNGLNRHFNVEITFYFFELLNGGMFFQTYSCLSIWIMEYHLHPLLVNKEENLAAGCWAPP